MINDIKDEVTKILLHIQKKEGVTRKETAQITNASLEDTAINLVDGNLSEKEGGMNKTVVNKEPKVGRNDPCPCGSGKKYKKCCGKNQQIEIFFRICKKLFTDEKKRSTIQGVKRKTTR